jgi:hypothetical protein
VSKSPYSRQQVKADVKMLFASAGDSPGQVASYLGAMGVRGVRLDPGRCAIAVFLHAVLCSDHDIGSIEVTDRYLLIRGSSWWRRSIYLELPPPVRAFVASFDVGEFPTLVRDQGGVGRQVPHPHGCFES